MCTGPGAVRAATCSARPTRLSRMPRQSTLIRASAGLDRSVVGLAFLDEQAHHPSPCSQMRSASIWPSARSASWNSMCPRRWRLRIEDARSTTMRQQAVVHIDAYRLSLKARILLAVRPWPPISAHRDLPSVRAATARLPATTLAANDTTAIVGCESAARPSATCPWRSVQACLVAPGAHLLEYFVDRGGDAAMGRAASARAHAPDVLLVASRSRRHAGAIQLADLHQRPATAVPSQAVARRAVGRREDLFTTLRQPRAAIETGLVDLRP